ncbi:MAG TPA: molybdopterin molybdotransferase MoeA [Gemmobacter sp.]|nr:molybdopterin molybdotransferase MoeA [Gemmobacter sp.]
MISVAEALERVLALAHPLPVEMVPLAEAAGRWLAEPVPARLTQPPFNASAMDGYAIVGPAPAGAAFTVIGEAGAGHAFTGSLGPGDSLRIFTGAPVPTGASHVALQEDVLREGNRITLTAAAEKTNIRAQGDDFKTGHIFAPRQLRPQDIALLAAMNLDRLPLRRRPEVAILTTGDELVMPGEVPRADQIVASNGFAIKALVEQVGGAARLLPIARDTEASLRAAFALAEGADVVVTIGGASVGDHDVVARLAPDLGLKLAFHKIAMRPGKPLIAGDFRGVPLLGLPGNPVSAFTCAHLFLLPLLRAMLGDPAPEPRLERACLAQDTGPAGPRAHYMRASVENGRITPFARQDSALLSVLCQANALLLRPAGDQSRQAGDMVEFLPI